MDIPNRRSDSYRFSCFYFGVGPTEKTKNSGLILLTEKAACNEAAPI